ncbi:MAG: glycosyl hydrolase family protein [Spirochaetaceae bacterium]|nr:MAG: glycosyl hydrolase family protein [Spirochaetaceae bacterium]
MNNHKSGAHAVVPALLLLPLVLLVVAACEGGVPGLGAESPHGGGGSLQLRFDTVSSMSLLPDISMQPASYTVTGLGPVQESFSAQTESRHLRVDGLVTGTWTVTVNAHNADGQRIGRGLETVSIVAAGLQELPIAVRPLPGPGTLELEVRWPQEQLASPDVDARLLGYDRSERQLPFSNNADGRAEFAADDIDAGYYTLALQLRDGESVVAGASTTVRIAEDARTSGSIVFDQLNQPAGAVDVEITPDLDRPLEVTIGGALESMQTGTVMQLSAVVANAADQQLFFAWYLNGSSAGNGQQIELGAELPTGNYRLDLVAYSSDGRRSGSATHSLHVYSGGSEPSYDFIDTFQDGEIDTAVWQIGTWTEHGGRLSRDRVYVQDDMLVMVFEYDTQYYQETGLFKSSAIQTRRDDFGYGRWEARLKPPDQDGVLPTMYTIDWRDGGGQTRQEIDIEFVTVNIGDDHSEVHLAVHGADFSSWSTQVELPFNPAADFHVWGFDISPERIQWFVDDIVLYEYWYDQQAGWIDAPYMLKFNFWSAMYQPGTPGAGNWILGPPAADTEIYYYIDWVRFTPYSP